MRGPGRFFLIRHGETAWNRAGRLQGGRDVALNPLGRRQGAAAGKILDGLLRDRGLTASDVGFVVSPLARARDTMDLVRGELGPGLSPVLIDERWRELSFGAWEGRTWDDLKRAEPTAVAERRRDPWAFLPPDGESYAALLARIAPALALLAPDTVLVTHGGVARVLLHHVAGVEPQRATAEEIHQGRVLVFEGRGAVWS